MLSLTKTSVTEYVDACLDKCSLIQEKRITGRTQSKNYNELIYRNVYASSISLMKDSLSVKRHLITEIFTTYEDFIYWLIGGYNLFF